MKPKPIRLFSRVAMMLLMMLLTTMTAWALNVTMIPATGGGSYNVVDGTKLYVTPATGYYLVSVTRAGNTEPLGEVNGYYTVSATDDITITFRAYTNKVHVKFNMNGHGDAIADRNQTLGETVERPTPDPTAGDAIFLGWFTNSSCTTPYDFTTPLDNTLAYDTNNDCYKLTLYAGWQVISGSCGTTTSWTVSKSAGSSDYDVLTISGMGDMNDYGTNNHKAPWYQDYHSTIKTVIIGDGVTNIGNAAFDDCDALTSVTIPASVASIGIYAFKGCDVLTSVTIPANVTSIGEYAFYSCEALISVTVYATAVPTLGSTVFFHNTSGRKIYVFSDRESDYKGATKWSYYANDIKPIANVTVSGVTANQNPDKTTDNWCTYYHPQANVKINTAGVKIFKASLSGSTLTLTEVAGNVIKAGQAVVLKAPASGALSMELTSSTATGDFSGNELKGTSATLSGATGNIYVLNYKSGTGVGFYRLKTTGTLGANKAYLTFSAPAANVREYFGFSETTAIETVAQSSDSVTGGAWYTLSGIRLQGKPTKSGMYIHNGKKEVLK